jgi:predicted AAA+ superfamily ATPase
LAGELAGVREGFVSRLFEGILDQAAVPSVADDLPARLVRGGYPEAIERDAEARRAAWFAAYISTILQRDVRDLARVDALHALPNLLKLLAARASGLLNLADVRRDAGLPHTTLTGIKANATAAASDFTALRTLREQLGQRFRGGVVLYLGNRMVPFGEQLWLAPLPVLWAP